MIQEFDISITAVGDDKYLVRTEQVAPGVPLAQEQVTWPVEHWLKQAETLMHDPLLGLLKGQPSQRLSQRTGYRSGALADDALGDPVPSLVSLGQDLYSKLFCGMLRDSWLTAQGVAQNRHNVLRLRLGIKDPRLQQLPWEVLHAGDRPLATGTDVTFSRYHADMRQGRDVKRLSHSEERQPLRILIVIAAPNDQERLELKHEVHHLQTELQPSERSSGGGVNVQSRMLDVQLTILEQPGRNELTQALEQGNFQVVHYAGHSNLGNAGGDLYLVSRQTGLTESLSGEDLAGLLVNNGVKLAVFNSCRGAYTANEEAGWQEQNLAQALVSRGVPGVIAMAERIPDDVAITFTQLLYRNLKQGHPIDLSLNRTRQGLISAYGSYQFHWALPILYMQPSFNGYLTEAHRPEGSQEQDYLDQLLTPDEAASVVVPTSGTSDLAASGARASSVTSSNIEPTDRIVDGVTPDIPAAELDELVETLEYDELLRYDDDDSSMAEVLGQLSDPSEAAPVGQTNGAAQAEVAQLTDQDVPLVPLENVQAKPPLETTSGNYPDTSEHSATSAESVASSQSSEKQPRQRKRLAVLAGAGLVVAAAVGLSWADPLQWFRAESGPQLPRIGGPSTGAGLNPIGQGSQALVNGDLDTATEMVGILISQNNLQQAMNLIMSADEDQKQDPVMLFLKGRTQWELHKQGVSDYSTADAMSSWQLAHESNRRWVDVLTALGFAYYDQDQLGNALDVWSRAIELAGDEPFEALGEPGDKLDQELPTALNAYAGLSMLAYQFSQDVSIESEERERLMQQSIDYQSKLFDKTGPAFLPANLGNNWLWTEPAIADWTETQQGLSAHSKAQEEKAQKTSE
ncbi:MAG: CHAT domain-containing protein [Cyanobacteria bacterium J06635_1]